MKQQDDKIISIKSFKEKRAVIAYEELREMELLGMLDSNAEEQTATSNFLMIPLEDGSLRFAITVPPNIDPIAFFKSNFEPQR